MFVSGLPYSTILKLIVEDSTAFLSYQQKFHNNLAPIPTAAGPIVGSY
jgi:hypothetical protein